MLQSHLWCPDDLLEQNRIEIECFQCIIRTPLPTKDPLFSAQRDILVMKEYQRIALAAKNCNAAIDPFG